MTTLAEMVAAAMPAALDGRVEVMPDAVFGLMPAHVQQGRPSKKVLNKAVIDAGWRRVVTADGPVFRAPQAQSDPLARHGEPGDNIAAEQLRQLIERIERLAEEKQGIADDIKDVFAEAKSTGFDTKTMRPVIRLRKLEKHALQEADALLETYRAALGMA